LCSDPDEELAKCSQFLLELSLSLLLPALYFSVWFPVGVLLWKPLGRAPEEDLSLGLLLPGT